MYISINKQVGLKLVELSDAPILYKLINESRAYLREWLPWIDRIKSKNDMELFILNCFYGYEANGIINTVILFNKKIVGMAGYNMIDWMNRTTSIGYWIDQRYQGKGITTLVAYTLTDYAFKNLKLNRVEIRAAVQNKKSRAIPEKLGYQKEGRLKQAEWVNDRFLDHVLYGIVESDWK
ncbi:alanine acetyltransferase [Sutcliffiella cohnii]|uniref:Alanine acetyltransferase n=1 Tax=Sutcliffiella cohnii TaxID=33932 RepID=A0A223KPV3_9BACI|nr:GNAT family protein [Sutcliffiella cohnii]AST91555.1 alanine acetyltransferase [Sutcliffiella cohnii]